MKDKRGTIRIDVSLLRNFIETHYNVYSRDVVTINGLDYPLVLSISMEKNFIVSLGPDILYSGTGIAEAINIFNMNVKDLKQLWTNLEASSRNLVSHPLKKEDGPERNL